MPTLIPISPSRPASPEKTLLEQCEGPDARPRWAALQQLHEAAIRGVSHAGAVMRTVWGRRDESPAILMYHRVASHVPDVPAPTINVTPQRLRAQLAGLQRRGYQFWSLSRLLSEYERQRTTPRNVLVVTFDDGYLNMASEALPVLQDLRIPATVFVCTSYLDGDQAMPFDTWGRTFAALAPPDAFQPLSWDDCQQLLDSGLFDIGAHTHTHRDFRGQGEAFAEDLSLCVRLIRQRLGIQRPAFAFPFGYTAPQLAAGARAAGVRCSLTTIPETVSFAADPYRWGRFNVFPWDSSATIEARVSGWYSWLPRWRRRVTAMLQGRPSWSGSPGSAQ